MKTLIIVIFLCLLFLALGLVAGVYIGDYINSCCEVANG